MNSTTTNSSFTNYLARCQHRTRSGHPCPLAVSGSELLMRPIERPIERIDLTTRAA
ncbi:MAG TPA: hypothetical protein VHF01_00930 [Candidatus Acidoferrum sp.]|nr:hypothetical protein [Candidatus Acidoferrum sp.]